MRKVKKLLGLLLAAVMVLAMGVPTFAAEGEGYTITINNETSGHTYEAYQVFQGDLSGSVLSNIEWGTGVNGAGLQEALKGESAFADCESAAEVAEVLDDYGYDSDEMKAFADIVAKYFTTANGTSVYVAASDAGPAHYTISNLPEGYYLIKDADASLAGKDDAYTDYILQVVKDVSVDPKSDVPTVEKKVQENSDKYDQNGGYGDGYNDVADWNIGDEVPFKLIGTLPDEDSWVDYTTYTYIFHDTMSTGLSLVEDSIHVYIADKDSKDEEPAEGKEIPKDAYDILVPGTENAPEDACSFEVSFENLKPVRSVDGTAVSADSIIIVKYNAILNENAEIGLPGNTNNVYLEFSNNPNGTGTGETPKDYVIVFTYELDVTKVAGEDTDHTLSGAEFKLYREIDNPSGDDPILEYVIVDSNGKVTDWTTNKDADGTTLRSGSDGKFIVSGLDDGTYYLEETKAPDGYNKLPNPIEIVINATTSNGQEWQGSEDGSTAGNALTALTIKVDNGEAVGSGDDNLGIVDAEVKNNAGSTLPGTGGMGTTIFYVLGAILVLGAGGLLIARRRTDSEK